MRPETRAKVRNLLRRRVVQGQTVGLFDEQELDVVCEGLERLRKHEAPALEEGNLALCIAYVDHVRGAGSPASALVSLFNDHLADSYSLLHVLPHFPCPEIRDDVPGPPRRADGGFEPKSFDMDTAYGTTEELAQVRASLMLDFVVNHMSAESDWFQKFLRGDAGFEKAFVALSPSSEKALDLAPVFRPRAHHPLVSFGEKRVWCTFSNTQVDVNVRCPHMFLRLMEVLFRNFIGQGARWIRLDAIGYLVKSLGVDGQRSTSCFGIEETHAIVKVMRLLVDELADGVKLVAEVNAPGDVIDTYFGDGDEAHITYDFPAAPLSLLAIYRESAEPLRDWLNQRVTCRDKPALGFTSSHDGIGLLPVSADPETLAFLAERLRERGARINMKTKYVDGEAREVPYEACITWPQAILEPGELVSIDDLTEHELDVVARRFIASQSFVLAAPHLVPADYLGALAGLLNAEDIWQRTQHHRDVNRGQILREEWEAALSDPRTGRQRLAQAVLFRKRHVMGVRRSRPAFALNTLCRVPDVDPRVFAVWREPEGGPPILALTNCAPVAVELSCEAPRGTYRELLSDTQCDTAGDDFVVELSPYQVAWFEFQSMRP